MYFFIGVILYILIGVIRVGYDFIQPYFNQPRYIYEMRWDLIILYTFLWPILMYSSGDFYYFWQYLKKTDTSTTQNTHKEEPTGINKLSNIENKLKDKKEKKEREN